MGEREVVADGDAAGLGHNGLLGEAGHLAHVGQALAALVEPGGAVEHGGAGCAVRVAEVGPAGEAEVAAAAVGDKGEDDPVARRDASDAFAHVEDCACALVAQDCGELDLLVAVHEVQVAATDAGRAHLDVDLVGLGRVEFHLFNGQGLVVVVENSGFHRHLLPRERRCGVSPP